MTQKLNRYHPQTLPGRLMLILTCACGLLALGCWLFGMLWPRPLVLQLLYGRTADGPVVVHRDFCPPGKLTDIAVNDESLFLLYAAPGIVNAYSHEGEYQYSILFPYESNGSSSLYASGNDLYYVNRWNKVFHVQGRTFRQSWRLDEGQAKLRELQAAEPGHQDTQCWYGDERYVISGQNVDRVMPDGTKARIVDGPELLGLLESRTVWFGCLTFLVLTMILYVWTIRLDRLLIRKRA